jgi:small-conductance mechanosensitive channel
MILKDILNYQLIKSTHLTINVYDIVIGVFVVFIALLILRLIRSFFKKLESNKKIQEGAGNSIYQIIKYLIWVIVLSIELKTVGIDVTVLVASSAALFVGLGFGLQNLFNDIASGIILLVERTLMEGDVVELEDHTVGKVISINLRTSTLKSRDNISVIIPNSKLVNDKVINWSHIDQKTRFSVAVGVAYGSDINLVSILLKESVKNISAIEKKPAAFVRFNNFGDSSLEFMLFFWTKESFDVENIKSKIRFEINRLFAENDVVIAFPQLDVHIDK